jgi:hypothetical protein
VSSAPFDADGLDWLDGMSALDIEEFTRARAGEAAYRPRAEQLAHAAVVAAFGVPGAGQSAALASSFPVLNWT